MVLKAEGWGVGRRPLLETLWCAQGVVGPAAVLLMQRKRRVRSFLQCLLVLASRLGVAFRAGFSLCWVCGSAGLVDREDWVASVRLQYSNRVLLLVGRPVHRQVAQHVFDASYV